MSPGDEKSRTLVPAAAAGGQKSRTLGPPLGPRLFNRRFQQGAAALLKHLVRAVISCSQRLLRRIHRGTFCSGRRSSGAKKLQLQQYSMYNSRATGVDQVDRPSGAKDINDSSAQLIVMEVARSAKGRRRRPVERAPEAPRFHVCALRAHFQQKYGKGKHGGINKVLFRVRSCVARSKFMVLGSQNPPKIVQNRSEKLLGHRVGRKSVPKVTWEAPGRPERRFREVSRVISGANGRARSPGGGSAAAPLGYGRTAGEG